MRYILMSLISLMMPVLPTRAEVLLEDDFSGDLSENWVVFGDPIPYIDSTAGSPSPSFCNNGDSMYGSGVISREAFSVEGGLILEADIYLACSERGAWVHAAIGFVSPDYIDGENPDERMLADIGFSYLGELNWLRPHLGLVMRIGGRTEEGRFHREHVHADSLLADWHRLTVELDEDGLLAWLLDGEPLYSTTSPIQAGSDSVRIHLGGRSTHWGIALHDNVILRRP